MRLARLSVLMFVLRVSLMAQGAVAAPASSAGIPPETTSATAEPQTRAEAIEAERKAKAATVQTLHTNPAMNAVEQFVTRGFKVWNATQTGFHGLSANIGGLAVGSQIAIGPEFILKGGNYYKPQVVWDTYLVAAGDKSFRFQSGMELPRLNRGREFFSLDAYRYEYTRLLYFGPGDTSAVTGRSDYSQRESGFEFRGGTVIRRKVRLGLNGSARAIAIGPGTDPDLPPTDSLYTVAEAHGVDRQTTFLSGGFFAEYENRDQPGDPHHGTYFGAHFQNVSGSRRALGGFNQYDFDGQVYVPFVNRTRVLAFRGRASLTTPHSNSFVPFYMEPRLGGSDDLRGFSTFRFHDQNDIVMSAEYRWTVIPLLDMVLFSDAGKVYHDADSLTFSHVVTDVGVGIRARTGGTVPFRFDIGVSHEGVQVWLILVNLF